MAKRQKAMRVTVQKGGGEQWAGLEELNAALSQGWEVETIVPLGGGENQFVLLAVLEGKDKG